MVRQPALKIAILGWGSLIWDRRPEFDDQHEQWEPDGPLLKLEFSRISESRQGALTLVIDDVHGEECRVQYALSKRRRLEDAIADLRCREGTVLRRIGNYRADGSGQGAPPVPDAIKAWVAGQGFYAVIWTGLPSNFKEFRKKQELPDEAAKFSVDNAIAHIQGLSSQAKAMAATYVWRAPDYVNTPLRRALQAAPWFTQPASE